MQKNNLKQFYCKNERLTIEIITLYVCREKVTLFYPIHELSHRKSDMLAHARSIFILILVYIYINKLLGIGTYTYFSTCL